MRSTAAGVGLAIFTLAIGAVLAEPPADLKPLTVHVLDDDTGEPVKEFRYSYWVRTPDGRYDTDQQKWQSRKSATGTLTLNVPAAGILEIGIKARPYLAGYAHTYHTIPLKAADADRKPSVRLTPGVTVAGLVLDSRTKTPIPNASVMPTVFTPPLTSPDEDRAVVTGEFGTFILPGVEPSMGISVRHLDYQDSGVSIANDVGPAGRGLVAGKQILLERGETIRGRVTTPDGRPLAGVSIEDGSWKKLVTDAEGRFVFNSPSKWWNGGQGYNLTFHRDGSIPRTLNPTDPPPAGLAVVLEPLFELRGRVVRPDGGAVPRFTIMAGPGPNPADYKCTRADVASAAGDFVLTSESAGDHWVGVRADGFACWEGRTNVGRKNTPITITLKPGVRVGGTFALPVSSRGPWEITLAPLRPKLEYSSDPTPASVLATLKMPVAADGTFTFPHVRPDQYRLSVAGRGLTTYGQVLTVGPADVRVPPIVVRGTGRIVGRIFNPQLGGKPWAYAAGEVGMSAVSRGDGKSFTADEDGRFTVDDAPAGDVMVSVSYQVTTCIVAAHVRGARVLPGQTTEVRFFDAARPAAAVINVVVGDGSQAQFDTGTGAAAKRKGNLSDRLACLNVWLTPLGDRPASYSVTGRPSMDGPANASIALPDVTAGRYRILVHGWTGSIGQYGALAETEAEFGPGRPPVPIALGGGSVAGKVEWAVPYKSLVGVTGKSADGKTVRTTCCDSHGIFCLPYLTPGRWELIAHDDDSGWCRIGAVTVNNDAGDCGVHKLEFGGSIRGRISAGIVDPADCRVVAVDAGGMMLEAPFDGEALRESFRIGNLWPGTWTVKLLRGEAILATSTANVKGTKETQCDLTVP